MPKHLSCKFRESTFVDYLKCVDYKTISYQDYLYLLLNKLSGDWFEKLNN